MYHSYNTNTSPKTATKKLQKKLQRCRGHSSVHADISESHAKEYEHVTLRIHSPSIKYSSIPHSANTQNSHTTIENQPRKNRGRT
mmetsp:Transcript_45611/g.128802  ORF Transcript_45611/g.128802 Transcript_45611/m.128802 type:complete len:85 (-) Transcript_45611:550-804(-)